MNSDEIPSTDYLAKEKPSPISISSSISTVIPLSPISPNVSSTNAEFKSFKDITKTHQQMQFGKDCLVNDTFNKISNSNNNTSKSSNRPSTSKAQSLYIISHAKLIGCCLTWYTCSALTNNSGKLILSQFHHALTLNWFQFVSVWMFCLLFSKLKLSPRIQKLNQHVFWNSAPLSIFQIGGHILSSIALSYVSVTFSHSVKALSPLFTVFVYRFIFKISYPRRIYLSLIPLTSGVILACLNKMTFHWIGFICSLTATWVFVIQNIFSKKIFNNMQAQRPSRVGHAKLDKMNLLFYSSFFASILLFPFWLFSEASEVLFTSQPSWHITKLYTLNAITHFAQNYLAFTILGWVSPVSYSIASLVKRIVVIMVSILVFKDKVSFSQMIGIGLTFYGLWLYDSTKFVSKDNHDDDRDSLTRSEMKRKLSSDRSFLLPVYNK